LGGFVTSLRFFGLSAGDAQASIAAKAFDFKPLRALHALERFADVEHLLHIRDFQLGRTLEIGIGLFRATGAGVDQAAKVEDAWIERPLVDGLAEELMRFRIIRGIKRVHAAAI
jgi:hypothetical protein